MAAKETNVNVVEKDPEIGQSGPTSRSASTRTFAFEGPSVPASTTTLPTADEQPLWRQKISRRIPRPVKKTSNAIVRWVKGPEPPRIWKIRPLFPQIQEAPLKLVNLIAPKRIHKLLLLGAFYFVWLLIFITVLDKSDFSASIPGFGTPQMLSCTASLWEEKNECGIDGNDCRPFSNTSMAFRCPAHCITTEQLNPYAVGTQNLIYQPLVIGGPTDPANSVDSAFYRGDSFICGAAVHAGYFSDVQGGCGVVELVGNQANFPAVDQNGISSFGFDSNFPLSFRFSPGKLGDCRDPRWPLLGVSVALTALLAIFTSSPAVFFWSTYCIMFFHCALVADPPTEPDYYSVVSVAVQMFLPATFVAAIVYQYCVRRTLTGLKAQFEKAILWLGAAWVGGLNDYTFDKIPIQRLTGHDIRQQPGAITALVIIVVVLFVIVIGQIWTYRYEGRLPRFLALYVFIGVCLGLLASIPNLHLRIHHYILGLLLLPGTSIQTRPSLLYQGLLFGLFVNGIARWGFASILQTSADLIQDGILGSPLPVVHQPIIHDKNVTLTWDTNYPVGADGISILVNDVERFRSYLTDDDDRTNFTWVRHAPAGDPEYFRFGYMDDSSALDYTKAATWNANGSWTPMQPGAG